MPRRSGRAVTVVSFKISSAELSEDGGPPPNVRVSLTVRETSGAKRGKVEGANHLQQWASTSVVFVSVLCPAACLRISSSLSFL